jgi:hypothetical protein
MTRPFTIEHVQALKNYAVRLYGSMDSKGMAGAEIVAVGRAMGKFRRWMIQKAENFYSPTEMTKKEGRWDKVLNAKGEVVDYKFIAQEYEGYVQSVYGTYKMLRKYGMSFSKVKSEMSGRRKENLGKLLSDLIMFAILQLIVTELLQSDFAKKTILGGDLSKGLANAVGDIMPSVGLFKTLDGSPMGAVSVATGAAQNTLHSIFSLVTGDTEKAAQQVTKVMESGGSYRVVSGTIELLNK